MSTTVERPKPGETDEDLLRLQAEFLAKKEKDLQLKPKSFNTAQTKTRSLTKVCRYHFILFRLDVLLNIFYNRRFLKAFLSN
jgi:hypothetical protein